MTCYTSKIVEIIEMIGVCEESTELDTRFLLSLYKALEDVRIAEMDYHIEQMSRALAGEPIEE